MATRSELVDAANDLNKVMDLSPAIDVKQGVEALKAQVKEAGPLLLKPPVAVLEIKRETHLTLIDVGYDARDEADDETRAALDEILAAVPEPSGAEDGEVLTETRAAVKEKKAAAPKTAKAPKKKKVAAPKAPKATKEKKAAGEKRGTRPAGKPSKDESDFHPLREGTIRGNIFSRMNSTRTIDEIASELGLTPSNTSSHIHCLWRDCGIGFSFDDNKRVTAVLPRGIDSAFRSA